MTQDDIILMAQEAGFVEYELDDGTTNAFDIRYQRLAHLVATRAAALEREACAKLCEAQGEYGDEQYAAAIRARSQS
jgi:hypothetical protein